MILKASVILCDQAWITVGGQKFLENQKIGPGS